MLDFRSNILIIFNAIFLRFRSFGISCLAFYNPRESIIDTNLNCQPVSAPAYAIFSIVRCYQSSSAFRSQRAWGRYWALMPVKRQALDDEVDGRDERTVRDVRGAVSASQDNTNPNPCHLQPSTQSLHGPKVGPDFELRGRTDTLLR
jgi:hypothetical protein